MRKYFIVFILIVSAIALVFYYRLKSDKIVIPVPKDCFVTIKNNKFSLEGKEYFPLAVNYMVDMQTNGKDVWATPCAEYNVGSKHKYTTKDSCLSQLQADFDLIKDLGFNSVRIVRIGEPQLKSKKTGGIYVRTQFGNERNAVLELTSEENYATYFNAIDEVLKIAAKAGLKVVFLVHAEPGVKAADDHLIKLVSHFKEDATIMAYDLFNEPLYFDTLERKKEDVYEIVKGWYKIMKTYAPNQLVTIGLTGIREVLEWDPNILEVDFLSIHPYEYEREQVRNEMFWYGKFIKKPWIIGETAIPADGDSVKYELQKEFAHNTLEQSFNCGGIGYTWWQYQDVSSYKFHANFMGVLNKTGETINSKGKKVYGTPKPVAEEFKIFKPVKTGDCKCFDNFYNYSQHKICKLIGYVTDEDGDPIEGGVILAWNQYWGHSYHTVTKADGSFELLGDFHFYHWMVSATNFTTIRNDISPDTMKIFKGQIPSMNLGKLKLEKLSF